VGIGGRVAYRDDLDAAHARNADLEQQIVALEHRQVAVAPRRRRGNAAALIATLAGLGLALGAVLGGLGWFVTASAVLVALIGASGLDSSAKTDAGPFPVRHTVEAPCADADVRLLVICLVSRGAPSARIDRRVVPLPFTHDAYERIVVATREVIEGVVRTAIVTLPVAELRGGGEALGAVVKVRVGAALEAYALIVDSLFVSLLR
jgi:hypothetical protein